MFISAITPAHLAPVSISVLRSLIPGQLSFGIDWPDAPSPRRARLARAVTRTEARTPDAAKLARATRPARPSPIQQFAIALEIVPAIVTPLMAEIERILSRIADVGGEMPNNPVLGERAGGRGRSSVDRALRRLDAIGRIKLDLIPGRRRVMIVASGAFTDWGEARPGHKPFCSRAKGAPPLPPKPRLPESQPLPASARTLPPLASLAGFYWTPPAVHVAAPSTCKWPMWADGETANDTFCGQRVQVPQSGHAACSWCPEHRAMVFLPARRRGARSCD